MRNNGLNQSPFSFAKLLTIGPQEKGKSFSVQPLRYQV